MKRYAMLLWVVAGVGYVCGSGSPQQENPKQPAEEVYQEMEPPPVPGFKWVRSIRYQEISHSFCKEVPDKRTRWIYSYQPDYFCLPRCPIHGLHFQKGCADCNNCQNCKGPYVRKKLLKKRVEWNYGTKCVVETVKEKVPYTAWRKVPIGEKDAEKEQTPELLPVPKESQSRPDGQRTPANNQ